MLLVLCGAARVPGDDLTPLERAPMPHLRALARAGTTARLRTAPPHLDAEAEEAGCVLLGWVPPARLDRAALAATYAGMAVSASDPATLVDVVRTDGGATTQDDVARAAASLRAASPRALVHEVRGRRLLILDAPAPAQLPEPDGLGLVQHESGLRPVPVLDKRTIVLGPSGAPLSSAARLLGARAEPLPGDPAALRGWISSLLLQGLETIVITQHVPAEPHEAARALGLLDRTLIGPLRAVSAWTGARFAVTCDLVTDEDGAVRRGDVPLIRAEAPDARTTPPMVRAGHLRAVQPATERAAASGPLLSAPFAGLGAMLPVAPAAASGARVGGSRSDAFDARRLRTG